MRSTSGNFDLTSKKLTSRDARELVTLIGSYLKGEHGEITEEFIGTVAGSLGHMHSIYKLALRDIRRANTRRHDNADEE